MKDRIQKLKKDKIDQQIREITTNKDRYDLLPPLKATIQNLLESGNQKDFTLLYWGKRDSFKA